MICRRGKARKEGGVGKKITGITPRKFKPNIQRLQVALPGGGTARMKVCAHCLRSGLVQKPIRTAPKA
jgi:large subunit ribosomal protein L28